MRGKPIVIEQFTGLFDQVFYGEADANVPQAAALDCMDVIGRFGGLKSRSGIAQSPVSCPVKMISAYGTKSGVVLMNSDNGNIYRDGSVLVVAAGNGARKWAEGQIAGVAYAFGIAEGLTPVKVTIGGWVGTNYVAATGTVPQGKDIAYTQARLFIGGDAAGANKSQLAWSASGDLTTWPAANVVQLDPGDGDTIQGVCALGPYVVVFKNRKTYLVYDLATGANRLVSGTIGCDSPDSYVVKGDTVYFYCATTGLCTMGTDGNVKVVSRNIDSMARRITTASSAAYQQRGPSVAAAADSIYICGTLNWASPIAGSQTRTLEFHIPTATWWTHSFQGLLVTRPDPSSSPALSIGGPSNGAFASISNYAEGVDSTGTNDLALGVNPQPWWGSGALNYGAPGFKKRLKVVDIEGNNPIGSVSMSARTDGLPAALASGRQLSFVGSGTIQSARLGAGFATSPTGARTVDRYLSMSVYSTARAQWWVKALTMNFTQRKN